MIPTRRIRSICLFAWARRTARRRDGRPRPAPLGEENEPGAVCPTLRTLRIGRYDADSRPVCDRILRFRGTKPVQRQSRLRRGRRYGPDRTGQAAGSVRAVRADSEQSARIASGAYDAATRRRPGGSTPEQAYRYAIRFDGCWTPFSEAATDAAFGRRSVC